MSERSVLDEVFIEELERAERAKMALERELVGLPKGYVSAKNIRGKATYYLQERRGEKVIGRYIPYEEVDDIKRQVERRREVQKRIKEAELRIKKLRRVVR